jgi:hypothetical protein
MARVSSPFRQDGASSRGVWTSDIVQPTLVTDLTGDASPARGWWMPDASMELLPRFWTTLDTAWLDLVGDAPFGGAALCGRRQLHRRRQGADVGVASGGGCVYAITGGSVVMDPAVICCICLCTFAEMRSVRPRNEHRIVIFLECALAVCIRVNCNQSRLC